MISFSLVKKLFIDFPLNKLRHNEFHRNVLILSKSLFQKCQKISFFEKLFPETISIKCKVKYLKIKKREGLLELSIFPRFIVLYY